jgi:hypothetical protein
MMVVIVIIVVVPNNQKQMKWKSHLPKTKGRKTKLVSQGALSQKP